ncbi:ATP-grasp domain-containing protein [Aquiflexum sp. LQ15W]|uniref:ATP-grasp domain-containing protein n=1 Tax=Cognataquiflexum nitidum TaxID=2922272 RepID=UPI001F1456D6|nr:ATP-grasp domain-containing protein [Cognataquiflexum nitidum]MCH6201604.1 ATP-grasp domain-containing protein [Cognataquiflexum nitidum]
MILLDYPYVSDFLLQTIIENKFEVIATKEAKQIAGNKFNNWIAEEDAARRLRDNPHTPIYTNSENSISWIQQHTQGTGLPEIIDLFKNKYKFRQLIKTAYPDYFFKAVAVEKLRSMDVSGFKFPFIIKPAVGFFSIAVYKVDSPEAWTGTVAKIEQDIIRTQSLYPKEVIDNTEFIIEQYIRGEEYAFDCYFDVKGNPVILNILHHVFTSENDVSDRVYSSSPDIIQKLQSPIHDFLAVIGSKVNLRNFPLHIEIRMDEKGKLFPIEVNPMRFGGWCTTGDLSWFAYGINSYEHFFYSKKPDWESIFQTRKGKKYSLILLDNTTGFKPEEIAGFDYDALLADFENPLHLRKIDLDKFGVFGFLFTETSEKNESELTEILHSDLKKYIQLKSGFKNAIMI